MNKQKKSGFFRSIKDAFKASPNGFEAEPFDPATHYPVIRASICTGEKVAGFRSKTDGRFTEVMLIRSKKDEEQFKKTYGVEKLDTEY